jgi:hypothetical protein
VENPDHSAITLLITDTPWPVSTHSSYFEILGNKIMLRREKLRKNSEILQDALEVMGAEWCLSKSTASELVDKMTGRHIGHYAHTWTVLVPFI